VGNNPLVHRDSTGCDIDSEFCRRLREKIDNVNKRIQRRIGQLDENPRGLPEACPGDKKNPSLSREGHRKLINEDKALMALLEATYAWRCKDKMPPPLPLGDKLKDLGRRTADWADKHKTELIIGGAAVGVGVIIAFPPSAVVIVPAAARFGPVIAH
jgi:hypothetical protein